MNIDLARKKSDNFSGKSKISDLNETFESIREELDEHRESINDTTNEIQANYEYSCRIEARLDKLTERLDQLQMFMQKYGFKVVQEAKFDCKPLTNKEQEVFLLLYTLEEKGPVTYDDISRRSGLTTELVSEYVTNMIEKGVPVLKRYIHNKVYLKLDPDFKKVQAKENILKISQTIIPNLFKTS